MVALLGLAMLPLACRGARSDSWRVSPARRGPGPLGALHIAAGIEAGEERADAVVREAAESEGGAFDALIAVLCSRRVRWRRGRGAS